MHIAMITGSGPADVCGVEDYTSLLVQHLRKQGVSVTLYYTTNWKSENLKTIISSLGNLGADLFHLQYPTHGYIMAPRVPGRLVGRLWRARTVVTLHEVSGLIRHGRRTGLPWGWDKFIYFSVFANGLIFNDGSEARKFKRWAPWSRNRCAVIPNGPTIPRVDPPEHYDPTVNSKVVFFGQIIRRKMLDDFFQLFELTRRRNGAINFEIIGGYPAAMAEIAEPLLGRARRLGIETAINLSRQAIAERLAAATYAYLPFASGAEAKRTSLLAALENRMIVLTPHGATTEGWVRNVTVNAPNPSAAADRLEALESDSTIRDNLISEIEKNRYRYDWKTISREHRELYSKILKSS